MYDSEFEAWLHQASATLDASTSAALDVEEMLATVKRRAVTDLRAIHQESDAGERDDPPLQPGDVPGALVGAAVRGERPAMNSLLRWIDPLVVRYCRGRLGRKQWTFPSADDVAQEVLLAVITALPHFRDQGRPFLAFVYGIAAHKVADAHRSAGRNKSDPVEQIPDELAQTDGPEQWLLQAELAGWMDRLLGRLPDKQREILVLRVVVGLSVKETAEAVGSNPVAVRVAQHRALTRLRKVMSSEEVA